MATSDVRGTVRENVLTTTVVLSALGYALVLGTFAGLFPIYPEIGRETTDLLSHAIAVVNTVATISLALGWYWIRNGEVDKHRTAMTTSFGLILVFLVLYLTKVGGGGEKAIVGAPDLVYGAYLLMLAIHIVLSVVSVPVVLYALLLGLTHSPGELRDTAHKRIGRIAAGSWILSLTLGVVTYVMLNHVYSAEMRLVGVLV
jgi:putative membrane protein